MPLSPLLLSFLHMCRYRTYPQNVAPCIPSLKSNHTYIWPVLLVCLCLLVTLGVSRYQSWLFTVVVSWVGWVTSLICSPTSHPLVEGGSFPCGRVVGLHYVVRTLQLELFWILNLPDFLIKTFSPFSSIDASAVQDVEANRLTAEDFTTEKIIGRGAFGEVLLVSFFFILGEGLNFFTLTPFMLEEVLNFNGVNWYSWAFYPLEFQMGL